MKILIGVNPLHLIIGEVNGYVEENNGNKYLTFASTDKNKKVLEIYTKFWDEIKYHIQTINAGKFGEYEKDYMRLKFNSDDDLPLNKILKLHNLTIIVRSVDLICKKKWIIINFVCYIYKMSGTICYQRNKYRELSEEEKNIKREYRRNRYHYISKEKKKRRKEYQRNYREAKKHLP